jgi:C1A family cysteine protease
MSKRIVQVLHNYGFRKDVNFQNDFETISKPCIVSIPPKFSLEAKMPPVYDQGQLGSCTANALCGGVEYLEKQPVSPSRLFLYYNERLLQGTTQQDSGSTIGTGITALINYGIVAESVWPYDTNDWNVKPDQQAYTEAKKDLLISFTHLTNLDVIKESIYRGYPVSFGFQVYEYMESNAMERNGILRLPVPGEKLLGGHAVLAVGYDDDTQMIRVRNSWGAYWGLNGYFDMPYKYITDPNLASDFWAINKMEIP